MKEPVGSESCAGMETDVARLQALVEEQRAKLADLEDYSTALISQQERADSYIASLEERLSAQDKLLTEQNDEGVKRRGEGEQELHQLMEIIEAQEVAIADQRRIVETQNGIISDLQRALNEQALGAGELQTPRSSTPSRCSDSRASGDGRKTSSRASPEGVRGKGGGSVGGGNAGQPPSARQRPAPSYPNRSPREQLLAQKALSRSREGTSHSNPGEPPRPRPNSAFERKAGSQRSRSLTAQGGAGDTSARGPSPGRAGVGPNMGTNARKANGTQPPHLPALRPDM